MSDRFSAHVCIWPWPGSTAAAQAVEDWVTNEFGEIHTNVGDAPLGAPVLSLEGELTFEILDAREGIAELLPPESEGLFREPALVDLLQSADLSFVFHDAGQTGWDGREVSWRPGMDRFRVRTILPTGAVALPESAADKVLGAATLAQVAKQLENYFADFEDYTAPSERSE